LILTQKLPVVFEADSADNIHRALDFCDEFKLRPIIYGGSDAWKAVDRLKKQQVPVLVRLNFNEQGQGRFGRRGGFGPFTPPTTPATPGTPGPPGTPTPPGTPGTPDITQRPGRGQRNPANPDALPGFPGANPDAEADQPEKPKRAQEDQQRQQKEEAHNAAVLSQQGILFAISTQGQTTDKPWD